MIDANVVIDVFESCIACLSSLLNTSVGGWIGGCIILCYVFSIFKQFLNL